MQIVESMLDLFRHLSDDDQRRLLRELARARLSKTAGRIADGGPSALPPITEEELSRIVHEARREVLRARGL